MKLVAIQSFRYAGQRLTPGDPFFAKSARDARLLKGIKRAKDAPPEEPMVAEDMPMPLKIDPEPAPEPASESAPAHDEMADLRAEYERVVGRRAFYGWDADELRRRMDEAGRYERRDMRADD